MKHLFLAAIIISSTFLTGFLFAEEETAAQHKNHFIAAELSITGQTKEFNDPYSLPAGIGILYELFPSPGIPFFFGAEAEWFGFIPLEENFGESRMTVYSLTSGYCLRKYFHDGSLLLFSPAVSAGQYFRSFEKNGKTYKGSKPVIKTGVDIMLVSEKNTAFSIGLFYFFVMDNTLFSFPGYRNRIGYVF